MSVRRAVQACATLERRAAARAACAAAAVRRQQAQRGSELAAVRSSRALLATRPSWFAAECAVVELRRIRGVVRIDALARSADRERRRQRAFSDERRKWAQMRRGLERRIERLARVAGSRTPWQG